LGSLRPGATAIINIIPAKDRATAITAIAVIFAINLAINVAITRASIHRAASLFLFRAGPRPTGIVEQFSGNFYPLIRGRASSRDYARARARA